MRSFWALAGTPARTLKSATPRRGFEPRVWLKTRSPSTAHGTILRASRVDEESNPGPACKANSMGNINRRASTPSSLVRPRGPDLRRAYRLGHAEEDHDALAAAARRERLVGVSVATVDVLPVVRHPHVARRRDSEVHLHLQAAAHVAARGGDLVAGLEAGRAVLRACATEVRYRAVGHREIGNPDVVVTIGDHRPGAGEAVARERRTGILRAIRPQQGDAAVPALLLGHGPYHVIRGRLYPHK